VFYFFGLLLCIVYAIVGKTNQFAVKAMYTRVNAFAPVNETMDVMHLTNTLLQFFSVFAIEV